MALAYAAQLVSGLLLLNTWTVGILIAMLLGLPADVAISRPRMAAAAFGTSAACFAGLSIWLSLGTGDYAIRSRLGTVGLQSPPEMARRRIRTVQYSFARFDLHGIRCGARYSV